MCLYVYMYNGNKNINTFLIKRYFANTYVAFSSSIKIEILKVEFTNLI